MPKRSTLKSTSKPTANLSKKAASPTERVDHAASLRERAASDGENGRVARELLHQTLLSRVYMRHLEGLTGGGVLHDALSPVSRDLTMDLADTVEPTDALERMLVEQATWTHARTAHLSLMTTQSTDLDTVVSLSTATDRASNNFRRLMLALKEYRQPQREPANHTSIGQANIAAQQVVQAAGTPVAPQKATNELGMDACPEPTALPEASQSLDSTSPPQSSTTKPKVCKPRRQSAATA